MRALPIAIVIVAGQQFFKASTRPRPNGFIILFSQHFPSQFSFTFFLPHIFCHFNECWMGWLDLGGLAGYNTL